MPLSPPSGRGSAASRVLRRDGAALCESDAVGTPITRTTIIWFVGAVVVGAVAAVLHVLRSEIGGGHDAVGLAVAAWVVTGLAATMVYRGIMTAAAEQDAARHAHARRATTDLRQ